MALEITFEELNQPAFHTFVHGNCGHLSMLFKLPDMDSKGAGRFTRPANAAVGGDRM
jgi:hypothetical protein